MLGDPVQHRVEEKVEIILVAVARIYAVVSLKYRVGQKGVLDTSHHGQVKVIDDASETQTLKAVAVIKVDSVARQVAYEYVMQMKIVVAKAREFLLNLAESCEYLSNH